jgi:hypothetical protein
LVKGDKSTSSPSRTDFRQIKRDCSGYDAGSSTSNDAADDHHREMDGTSLQSYAHTQNSDTSNTSPSTAKKIIERAGEKDVGEPRACREFSFAII